ncbi:MAG TPA: anthranilate synthase component I [Acidimicrobiia bacterium]|nr:anthranilate synthase component I [Acidimicrobiia bacterium]
MEIRPARAEFERLAAEHTVVPVATTFVADRETPVSAFEKLAGEAPGFLLESVEGGENWGRWSFVGWDPAFTLTSRHGTSGLDRAGPTLASGDPLTVLEDLVTSHTVPDLPGLPPLHSGAVGYMAFDTVRYVEHLPDQPPDDRDLPEMAWHFVGSLAAFDRVDQTITLVRNAFTDHGDTYDDAVAALQAAVERLGAGAPYVPMPVGTEPEPPEWTSTLTEADFIDAVEQAQSAIRAGDAFQIVVSQRLATEAPADAFDVYRALRLINPSPYLFFIRHPEVAVAGSSPELMTRVREGVAYSRPIAGTRRRGDTPEEDAQLAKELLADPKERAEHVMLVDLARNDLGRVCEFGTVSVDDLMVIERYSHVMHIVSGVSGRLRPGVGPVDVLRATFPHGTVSGAPKVAAIEIIDRLEPVARGPYAGAAGYIDFSGNVDTAICLRTVVQAAETAWIQAGAGIVTDSDPAAEYLETMDKAAAALAAIARARAL